MSKRKIPRELVETAINDPDEIVSTERDRLIYQKVAGNKLVRVVTESNMLVTVYVTSKIKKYMGEKPL